MLNKYIQVFLELESFVASNVPEESKFIMGFDKPTMPDVFMLPFLERYILLMDVYYYQETKTHAPKLKKYVENLRNVEALQDVVLKEDTYRKYLEIFKKSDDGKKPPYKLNYDY